jgi:hypothetical protein
VTAGLLVGFGDVSPPVSRSPPRVKTIDSPSGVNASSAMSMPSSASYFVSCRGLYSGASATQTFRTPSALASQAMRPFAGAVISSDANGALSTSSSENCAACAAAATKSSASSRFMPSRRCW